MSADPSICVCLNGEREVGGDIHANTRERVICVGVCYVRFYQFVLVCVVSFYQFVCVLLCVLLCVCARLKTREVMVSQALERGGIVLAIGHARAGGSN
jgi:hypothetical protein